MKMIARIHRGKLFFTPLIFIWFSILITVNYINAQSISDVYKLETPHFSLRKKISIALKQSIKDNSIKRIWLSYFISRENETDCFFYYPNQKIVNPKCPMLHEAIHRIGFRRDDVYDNFTLQNKPDISNKYHSANDGDCSEILIFMDYYLESGLPKLMQIYALPLNARFDFGNKPVYWLGKANQSESIDWLQYLFKKDSEIILGNQIIDGLSSHPPVQKIYSFLNQVLFNTYENTIKESAIFCLGNYGTKHSDYILSEFIVKSQCATLNKKAILALSQSNSPQAFYLLSSIAIKEDDKSTRKEAIFSLSQIDNQKSSLILKQLAFKDKNPDIQNFTVFALGQMQHPSAISILYQLSKSHPNGHIRKKALFWIGKHKNQKALH